MLEVAEMIATTIKQIIPNAKVSDEFHDDASDMVGTFVVNQTNIESTYKPSSEQMIAFLFDVVYFPKSETGKRKRELRQTEEALISGIDPLINADGSPAFHVSRLESNTIDDILHVTFTVRARMAKFDDPYFSGEVSTNTNMKN
ncbi:hypothetical protein JC2156_04320 [Weissella koreensis KCTC 3621]|uniref:phage tail terminator family protein n=1 Tax=Weissella koreensis TaxID=165096 RepID=UPI00026F364D|nr:hypothetical protein [Weissella koreensis]EJF33722.1 hypothetical protein JC2156_05360 [Weissella koreensis KCTC 3621]EJF34124.1 hypothetical protein JC2156_04320 [Weissella koreensis KCTC 3621]